MFLSVWHFPFCFNEGLNFNAFVARCGQFIKKRKWFCNFDPIFLVSSLDFIIQAENYVTPDILDGSYEICDGDDRFIDDIDTGFSTCLYYNLNTDSYDSKKRSLQEFCSACKVTLFEEVLVNKLIVLDKKHRKMKTKTCPCLFDVVFHAFNKENFAKKCEEIAVLDCQLPCSQKCFSNIVNSGLEVVLILFSYKNKQENLFDIL